MHEQNDGLLSILRGADPDARLAFLKGLPPSSMRDAAAPLLASENLVPRVIALNSLVTSYGFGQAAGVAGELARVAFAFGREVYEGQGSGGPLALFTVSAIASSGLHALNLVGSYGETVGFAEEVIPWLVASGEEMNLPDIRAHLIEALIGLHQIDKARCLLEEAKQAKKHSPHLARLEKRVTELTRGPASLPDEASGGQPPVAREAFDQMVGALEEVRRRLTKSGTEMNEWQANGILGRASSIFLDDREGRDPTRLVGALNNILPVEAWARESGHTDVRNDALWTMYLCLSRLQRWAEAADALQRLRENVEQTRAGIADPLRRAGVGLRFPHLYPSLCQMLFKADRVEELLGAMEAAKGRVVADVLSQREGRVMSEEEFARPATQIHRILRGTRAHYLSFLVDDEETLAVLVGKDGSLHAPRPILLGKQRIREASRHVDPRSWGRPDPAMPLGPKVGDMSAALAPLVAWLESHIDSGLIEEGDHLCYSPDEHLHQFPLGYVQLRGRPLAHFMSVSRTHGARALSLIAARPALRPTESAVFEVPLRQDPTTILDSFDRIGDWLERHLPGERYRREAATVEAVRRARLASCVVHFGTHGVFPAEGGLRPPNPFTHSGVVLADSKGLPDAVRLARGEEEDKILTPARGLEWQLDLTGSHVTAQACVTGLAREGIGGDALGLDWAVFQMGAASLLVSHWNVSAELSTEFCLRFYRHWLQSGVSRAAAWRKTVRGMMDEGGALAEPYAWAAFSLSGDWR